MTIEFKGLRDFETKSPLWNIGPGNLWKWVSPSELSHPANPLFAANAMDISYFTHISVERISRKFIPYNCPMLIATKAADRAKCALLSFRNSAPKAVKIFEGVWNQCVIRIKNRKEISLRFDKRPIVREMLAAILLLEITNRKFGGFRPFSDYLRSIVSGSIVNNKPFEIARVCAHRLSYTRLIV